MRVIHFRADVAEPITLFKSVASSSVELGRGSGEVRVHCVHLDANAQIGVHPTGFDQLFLVVQGSGWAVGGDGRRVHLDAGQGVFFDLGEIHSKGSDTGMIAIMVQATDLQPRDVVRHVNEDMSSVSAGQLREFDVAARAFCSWATAPAVPHEQEAAAAARHLALLFAAGCGLGRAEGEPIDSPAPADKLEAVRFKASALPFQYYSEIFNNLVVPPEEPVVGDIVDDLVDIYGDIAPGLELYDSGEMAAAAAHWQFWLASHWGEHATSALRALWSYLAEREGSEP